MANAVYIFFIYISYITMKKATKSHQQQLVFSLDMELNHTSLLCGPCPRVVALFTILYLLFFFVFFSKSKLCSGLEES